MQSGTFMKARCGPIQYRRSRTREDTRIGENIGNFGVLGDPSSGVADGHQENQKKSRRAERRDIVRQHA